MFENIKSYITRKSYYGLLQSKTLRGKDWGGSALDAYKISLYVNRALTKRAEKVGQSILQIETPEGEVKEEDDILKIIRNPNDYLNGSEFWRLYQLIKDVYGKNYIWLNSEREGPFEGSSLKSMHFLNPSAVKEEFDAEYNLVKYTYQQQNGKTIEYAPSEIIKSYYPAIDNPLKSESLLMAGSSAIDTDIQLSQYQTNVLKNGGKVEGVFKFKVGQLTKEQLSSVKQDYDDQYATAKKGGKPLFLGSDADYINLGLTPEELSYLETRKMTLSDICILTGVPKTILGTFDDAKYSNAQESLRSFYSETVNPLLDNLIYTLNQKFYKEDSNKLHYVDQSPEDKESKRQDLVTANTINAMTTNEKREMLGLEPVEGGDTVLVPFNLKDLTAEPTAPYLPPEEEEDEEEDEDEKKGQKKKSNSNHPLADFDTRRKYWKLKNSTVVEQEEDVRTIMNRYFDGQKKRFKESLGKSYTKDIVDDRFNDREENDLLILAVQDKFREIAVRSGEETIDFFNGRKGKDYSHEFIIDGELESWLNEKELALASQINRTTKKRLSLSILEGLNNEETNEQLALRVDAVYGKAKEFRSTVIARTEAGSIANNSALSAYKQVGLETKIWTAVMDGATRPSHAMLDGEEVPIDKFFSNGLGFPKDPRGTVEEVVACRCTI